MKVDILVIGGGAAGIAAAARAEELGESVLLVERENTLGGILNQCTHRGFSKTLTGREYLQQLRKDFHAPCLLEATVVKITEDKTAIISHKSKGVMEIHFTRLILAAGCLERTLGSILVGGTRPDGVMTAGEAQWLLNCCGAVLPQPVVILGSGDIGLILAQQLREKGQQVAAIVEQRDALGGLPINRRRIEGLEIPLYLGSRVETLDGAPSLQGIWIQQKTGERTYLPCRTLLTSIGLVPNRELVETMEQKQWIQLCGNCHKIHSFIETVVLEGREAAERAVAARREETHD